MSTAGIDTSSYVQNLKSLYPTYALRSWLTALLAQTQQAQHDITVSISNHEAQIASLRQHLEHSDEVVKSLQHAIDRVDSALQVRRDVDASGEGNSVEKVIVLETEEPSADEEGALKKK